MKQSIFTDEQIIGLPKQADAGMSVKELWSCPNSPDALTFLNKVIGFNDIGIQFFNTQVPFKFVG